MREIFFRGKRIDNGEWIYGDLIHAAGNCMICGKRGNLYVDPYTVSEFTGVHDMSGNSIYEGDIIKYKINGELRKGEVVYFEGAYRIKEVFLAIKLTLEKVMWIAEVIGNIWDGEVDDE